MTIGGLNNVHVKFHISIDRFLSSIRPLDKIQNILFGIIGSEEVGRGKS